MVDRVIQAPRAPRKSAVKKYRKPYSESAAKLFLQYASTQAGVELELQVGEEDSVTTEYRSCVVDCVLNFDRRGAFTNVPPDTKGPWFRLLHASAHACHPEMDFLSFEHKEWCAKIDKLFDEFWAGPLPVPDLEFAAAHQKLLEECQ